MEKVLILYLSYFSKISDDELCSLGSFFLNGKVGSLWKIILPDRDIDGNSK